MFWEGFCSLVWAAKWLCFLGSAHFQIHFYRFWNMYTNCAIIFPWTSCFKQDEIDWNTELEYFCFIFQFFKNLLWKNEGLDRLAIFSVFVKGSEAGDIFFKSWKKFCLFRFIVPVCLWWHWLKCFWKVRMQQSDIKLVMGHHVLNKCWV